QAVAGEEVGALGDGAFDEIVRRITAWRRCRSQRRSRADAMLVGAFACAHTPQLLARPSSEDRDLVLRVHAAFARVKRRLEALRADAIAIVAGDHVEAFFLDAVPAPPAHLRTQF